MPDLPSPPEPARALVVVIEDIPPLEEAVRHPQQGDCTVILAPVEYEHAVRWLRLGVLRATRGRPDAEVVSHERPCTTVLVPRDAVEAVVTELRAASAEFRRRVEDMPLDDLVADHGVEATRFIEETGAEVRLHPAAALRLAGLRLSVDGTRVELT
ncbi:MAG TPA: hypothetical protein VGE42_13410 [Candidatus Dormibacteraeota bacterium]